MAEQDLVYPRLIYRGEPDTLGTGYDKHGRPVDYENKRCENAEQWEEDQKNGWRLTREPEDSPAPKEDRERDIGGPSSPGTSVGAGTGPGSTRGRR